MVLPEVQALRRLPLATKGFMLAFSWLLLVYLLQVWLAPSVGTEILFAIPLVTAPPITALLTKYMVRYRVEPLASAVQRMGNGELGIELPPPLDPEFRPLQEAFGHMSRELKRLTAELRQRDAARRRMFADLAHEIATPVSSLLGLMDALSDNRLVSDEIQRARLNLTAGGEVERLAVLTKDVRALALLDDPDFELELKPVDLGALVDDVAGRVAQVGEGARIQSRCEPVQLLVDPVRIEQIVVNLLSNARRHTPADGHIAIEVRASSGSAQITVEDDGPGVPEDERVFLGERFRRTDTSRDRKRGGHGLGLSIVLAIAHRHGGSVQFDRSSRGGLLVRVKLPLPAPNPDNPSSQPESA